MSDSDTTGQVHSSATAGTPSPAKVGPRPDPVALLLLDTTTGRVVACNPAARRRLAGAAGSRLARWLCDLATAAGHRDACVVRTFTDATDPTDSTAPARIRAISTPVEFRTRDCLLVVLRDDASAPLPLPAGATGDLPAVDHGCAVFTLDPVGRVDSWGATPQRLFGHRADHVLGADATLLLTPPARLAGHHHLALTHAYRTGEHRAEGWRLCGDGTLLWAEAITAPLYDATDRLLGFAQVVQELTPVRRLQRPQRAAGPAPTQRTPDRTGDRAGARTVDLRGVPGQRVPAAPAVPASPEPGPRRPSGRIPTQRRP